MAAERIFDTVLPSISRSTKKSLPLGFSKVLNFMFLQCALHVLHLNAIIMFG